MRGKDLFDAMEHLEDRYIEEADRGNAARRVHWRIIVSAAACFACIATLWMAVTLNKEQEKVPEENLQTSSKEAKEVLISDMTESVLGTGMYIVTEEDMKEFNLQWQEKVLPSSYEYDLYRTYLKEHTTDVIGKGWGTNVTCGVVNSEGVYDFYVHEYDGTMSAGGLFPTFYSCWIPTTHMFQDEPQKLVEAIEENTEARLKAEEKMEYILKNLTEKDYGGIFYENESVCIQLVNEDYREELEAQGIVCKNAEYSYVQIYEMMEMLWNHREELEIVTIYTRGYHNGIEVCGTLPQEEFEEKLSGYEWKEDLNYTYYDTRDALEIGLVATMEMDDVSEFVGAIKAMSVNVDILSEEELAESEEYFKKLETALTRMKERYPEYTLLQLYYHISVDCEYENYMDFDEELEAFVASLPAYKIDMNFLNELGYGDSERLGLKQILCQAKQLYPDKTYQELYEMYPVLKEVEESNVHSKADSMFRYMYLKAVQKEQIKAMPAVEEKQFPVAMVVAAVLVAAVVILVGLIIKGKIRNKN